MIFANRGMIQLTGDVPELFADLVNVLNGIRDTFEKNSLPKEFSEEVAVLAAKVAFSPREMQDEFFSSLRRFRGRLDLDTLLRVWEEIVKEQK